VPKLISIIEVYSVKELKRAFLPSDGAILTVGASVRIKEGTADPDFEERNIGGWQGRVSGIYENEDGEVSVDIDWDNTILNKMPNSFLSDIEEAGLDFSSMVVDISCVELVPKRDTEFEGNHAVKEVEKKLTFVSLDDQDRRIAKILGDVDEYDYLESFQRWETHLSKTLAFPFEARVSEHQERGPLKFGDVLSVKKISSLDDLYGIIIEVRLGRKKYYFPLCDLDVVDAKSVNFEQVDDYSTWFANR